MSFFKSKSKKKNAPLSETLFPEIKPPVLKGELKDVYKLKDKDLCDIIAKFDKYAK